MESKSLKIDPIAERIIEGISRATRKLIEERASKNKNLIVADENGNPISVSAKDLLKSIKP